MSSDNDKVSWSCQTHLDAVELLGWNPAKTKAVLFFSAAWRLEESGRRSRLDY
jgi:hypothetical protein